jgi:hypothetical protein
MRAYINICMRAYALTYVHAHVNMYIIMLAYNVQMQTLLD